MTRHIITAGAAALVYFAPSALSSLDTVLSDFHQHGLVPSAFAQQLPEPALPAVPADDTRLDTRLETPVPLNPPPKQVDGLSLSPGDRAGDASPEPTLTPPPPSPVLEYTTIDKLSTTNGCTATFSFENMVTHRVQEVTVQALPSLFPVLADVAYYFAHPQKGIFGKQDAKKENDLRGVPKSYPLAAMETLVGGGLSRKEQIDVIARHSVDTVVKINGLPYLYKGADPETGRASFLPVSPSKPYDPADDPRSLGDFGLDMPIVFPDGTEEVFFRVNQQTGQPAPVPVLAGVSYVPTVHGIGPGLEAKYFLRPAGQKPEYARGGEISSFVLDSASDSFALDQAVYEPAQPGDPSSLDTRLIGAEQSVLLEMIDASTVRFNHLQPPKGSKANYVVKEIREGKVYLASAPMPQASAALSAPAAFLQQPPPPAASGTVDIPFLGELSHDDFTVGVVTATSVGLAAIAAGLYAAASGISSSTPVQPHSIVGLNNDN